MVFYLPMQSMFPMGLSLVVELKQALFTFLLAGLREREKNNSSLSRMSYSYEVPLTYVIVRTQPHPQRHSLPQQACSQINRSPPPGHSLETHQPVIHRQAAGGCLVDKQILRPVRSRAAWLLEACLVAQQPRRNRRVEEVFLEIPRSPQRLALDCLGTRAHNRPGPLAEVYLAIPTPNNKAQQAEVVCLEEIRQPRLKLRQNRYLARILLLLERVFCKQQSHSPFRIY
jgi:hypothetical protein